jgi:hypothetical protein
MRTAGLNKRQLAERLGWQPSQVARLFDGRQRLVNRPDRGGPCTRSGSAWWQPAQHRARLILHASIRSHSAQITT